MAKHTFLSCFLHQDSILKRVRELVDAQQAGPEESCDHRVGVLSYGDGAKCKTQGTADFSLVLVSTILITGFGINNLLLVSQFQTQDHGRSPF